MRRRDFITLPRRRDFLATVLACAGLSPVAGRTQSPPKAPLVGFILPGSKAASERFSSRFQLGMRELGYVEVRDYLFADRYADGNVSRLPSLAEELVRLKP